MITKKNLKIIHEWRENKYGEAGFMPPYNDREEKKGYLLRETGKELCGEGSTDNSKLKEKNIKNEKRIFLTFINKFPLSYTSLLAKINTSE